MDFLSLLIGTVFGFIIGFFWNPISKALKIFGQEVNRMSQNAQNKPQETKTQ